jgi:hypothetical protein
VAEANNFETEANAAVKYKKSVGFVPNNPYGLGHGEK